MVVKKSKINFKLCIKGLYDILFKKNWEINWYLNGKKKRNRKNIFMKI